MAAVFLLLLSPAAAEEPPRQLVPVEDCPLQRPEANEAARALRAFRRAHAQTDMRHLVTRVNRRAKTAEVRVDLQGKQFYVWLGFEVIDEKREAPSPGD